MTEVEIREKEKPCETGVVEFGELCGGVVKKKEVMTKEKEC